MNLDQAHSYLIIVLIRLECFAAPQKVVSASEASRACLQANSRSKRDLLRRRSCWQSVFGKPSVEGGSKLSADRSNEQASRRTERDL